MKRRNFLYGTGGLLTGYFVAPKPIANAQESTSGPIQLTRTSRLFAPVAASSSSVVPGTQIQDLAVSGQQVIALYRITQSGSFAVAATDRSGSPLWNQSLPKGLFLGLGFRSLDSSVLLYAVAYKKSQNCVVQLNPSNAAMTVVGQTAPGPALRFAGDSRLARATSGAGVELWDVTSAPTLSSTFQSAVAQDDQNPLIEALSSGGLAVFSHNSFQIGVVNPATGSVKAFALVSQEITAASVYYKKYNGTSTVPTVITASGFDRSGRLSILISPYFDNIGTVLSIDPTSGTVTGRMQFALPPRSVQEFGVPHSIVGNSTETGIVYTDGSVAWYQA